METGNKNIVLVMGKPSSGKSTSLKDMPKQESIVYLNTDLKECPFKDQFKHKLSISNPQHIFTAINEIEAMDDVETVALDTITFLMNMFETQFVIPAANGQKAWLDYAEFYKSFIHAIKSGTKNYAIMAHESDQLNEKEMVMETKVPVKGQVGKLGVEADFTTILAAKRIPVKILKNHPNDLLTITDINEEDGFKYVFQTRVTKDTMGERMRSAWDLWTRDELYINNDLSLVFNRLHNYYK